MGWNRDTSSSCRKGKKGEQIAVAYLQKIGYHIIMTNYRCKRGELDIVALDKRELVVLEVKSGRNIVCDLAEKISPRKKRRIENAVRDFLYRRQKSDLPVRFEIISVTFPENEIYHYREQFFD